MNIFKDFGTLRLQSWEVQRGNHGGTSQTKYRTGEDIIVKYNSNNPERHEILNDKDKTFTFKVFKIVGKILMIIPLIFLIISFFAKGQVQ